MARKAGNRGRVRARRCAVQALYQWQLNAQEPSDIIREFVAEREFDQVDVDYFNALMHDIPAEFEQLTSDLRACIDREWDKLDPVERSVLLIGAYEMRHRLEVPYRVVINEGVELCKMFGTVEGHRYVNGVLDRLAHAQRAVEVAAAP